MGLQAFSFSGLNTRIWLKILLPSAVHLEERLSVS